MLFVYVWFHFLCLKKREMSLVDQASEENSSEWKFPGSNDEQFERFVQMVISCIFIPRYM